MEIPADDVEGRVQFAKYWRRLFGPVIFLGYVMALVGAICYFIACHVRLSTQHSGPPSNALYILRRAALHPNWVLFIHDAICIHARSCDTHADSGGDTAPLTAPCRNAFSHS